MPRQARLDAPIFRNRYKSVVCEEEAYFRELVRYRHLNPLRAKVVVDLRALDLYPRRGQATLPGHLGELSSHLIGDVASHDDWCYSSSHCSPA